MFYFTSGDVILKLEKEDANFFFLRVFSFFGRYLGIFIGSSVFSFFLGVFVGFVFESFFFLFVVIKLSSYFFFVDSGLTIKNG